MPVYEYFCKPCDGIFEIVRNMREADEPGPCPVCDEEGQRLMPTTFTAFVVREGLARRLPDKGTYRHLGADVSRLQTRGNPLEHPELARSKEPPITGKQDFVDSIDKNIEVRRRKRAVLREQRSKKLDAKSKRGELKTTRRSLD